jgi:hypothetical protein
VALGKPLNSSVITKMTATQGYFPAAGLWIIKDDSPLFRVKMRKGSTSISEVSFGVLHMPLGPTHTQRLDQFC